MVFAMESMDRNGLQRERVRPSLVQVPALYFLEKSLKANNRLTMDCFPSGNSLEIFVLLFSQTSSIHAYNKRSSSKNNMYIKKFNLEKLRQAVPIFGAKLWNEIPGRMRDMSKKVFKRKLISVLFGILKDKDDYLDATMITWEIKSRNPEP